MKKLCLILPMALILCFMVGCQDKEAMAELEVFKAQIEVEEQNKALVKRYFELHEEGKIEELGEIVAFDCVAHYPGISPDEIGLEAIKQGATDAKVLYPDMQITIEIQIAEGNLVATLGVFEGTHIEEFKGVAPKGEKNTFTFIEISRISDGKIVEEWIVYNVLDLMQQLGMELKPKEKE